MNTRPKHLKKIQLTFAQAVQFNHFDENALEYNSQEGIYPYLKISPSIACEIIDKKQTYAFLLALKKYQSDKKNSFYDERLYVNLFNQFLKPAYRHNLENLLELLTQHIDSLFLDDMDVYVDEAIKDRAIKKEIITESREAKVEKLLDHVKSSILLDACQDNNVFIIQKLLKSEIRPTDLTKTFHSACQRFQINIINLFLNLPQTCDWFDSDDYQYFLFSEPLVFDYNPDQFSTQIEIFRTLLSYSNIASLYEENDLFLKDVFKNYVADFDALIQVENFDTYILNVLFIAYSDTCYDSEKLSQYLKNPRIEPSFLNNYLLKIAYEKGDRDLILTLLKNPKFDPVAGNHLAFEILYKMEEFKMLKEIVNHPNVDPIFRERYQNKILKKE